MSRMEPEERAQLLADLERGRNALLEVLDGVTEEVAAKSPGVGRWSVMECVEHLALSEDYLFSHPRQPRADCSLRRELQRRSSFETDHTSPDRVRQLLRDSPDDGRASTPALPANRGNQDSAPLTPTVRNPKPMRLHCALRALQFERVHGQRFGIHYDECRKHIFPHWPFGKWAPIIAPGLIASVRPIRATLKS